MPSRVPYTRSIPLGLKMARPPRRARKAEAKAEAGRFYAGVQWRRLRAAFLADNPVCADCLEEGQVTAATIAHHEEERLDNPDRALDSGNLTALCNRHHTMRHKKGKADGQA